MSKTNLRFPILAILLSCAALGLAGEPPLRFQGIPVDLAVQILQAEDTRQWSASLESLFSDRNEPVRLRAMLAAGRIGDAAAVQPLSRLLAPGTAEPVAAMAAFALGEIESPDAVGILSSTLKDAASPVVRAASVEALGKIAAALPENAAEARKNAGDAIVGALTTQSQRPQPEREVVLRALTAALRARPEAAPGAIAAFLASTDARIRADALNALARIRAKESLERIRTILTDDPDPIVRANAARVLGAAVDGPGVAALQIRMTDDPDLRVRVAAIRALASIAEPGSGPALLKRGEALLAMKPLPANELLEIATALGRALPNTNDAEAVAFLVKLGNERIAPEIEVAFARIAPHRWVFPPEPFGDLRRHTWQLISAQALAFAELAMLKEETSSDAAAIKELGLALLRYWIRRSDTFPAAMPDVLRALQTFAPPDLGAIIRTQLRAKDVVVRSTAADILAELPPSPESTQALIAALGPALRDKQNDAALSVVGALAKIMEPPATTALLQAARSSDHLVRRRAIDGLKGRAGISIPAVGAVKTQYSRSDYLRAAGRAGKRVQAVLTTDKGAITIELNAAEAPLTVDSFVRLAGKRYFDGLTFHRVVPNFVIQGGDPRGDGSGGPGYTIRCEINELPYETGAVGMALSGKDTGGSQFFITHSPQPHLDGGYTVFGRVVSGQNVVDAVERGDRIRSVRVME